MKSPLLLVNTTGLPNQFGLPSLSVPKTHVQFIFLVICTLSTLPESKDKSVMDYLFTKMVMIRILYNIMIL